MKSYREMRREAWKTAKTRWALRLLLTVAIFMTLAVMVYGPLAAYYQMHSIQTWGGFCKLQSRFVGSGLEVSVPSAQQFWSMTWASGFQSFVEFLVQGLLVFGVLTVALRAVRREERGWFGSAFGGFRMPLGMLWLNMLMSVRIALWSLLFIIPGVIAAFRYSMAWYVKTERPELSASECLAESGRMMKGRKLHLFVYGLTFLGWAALAGILMLAAALVGPAVPLAGSALFVAGLAVMMFFLVYVIFGQAVYYVELKRCLEKSETDGRISGNESAESAAAEVES